ncbi:class I SAM-dependent methyltransferase [Gordonia shandongensis]|uniref:class I SAM-dependent methyltransferase n=1 Tax=Gordonia shandongensis TaxID=376351 RepID=UPI000414852A|nr:class I SAM-dependent methyltransferase [Gordonia shandongensis]
MGFYSDRVLPRIIRRTCGLPMMTPLRRRACGPLYGDVVEVGFGSGLNVGLYPAAVTSVTAVEPNDTAWRLGRELVSSSAVPIDRSGLDGSDLPFADDAFDCALSTFTLCTIPDLPRALGELRRVVRPGGTLAFLEHGRAPDAAVRRSQRRFEPFQRRFAGGCHLTRDVSTLIEEAGWEIVDLDRFYAEGTPRPFGAIHLGAARN